MCIPTIKYKIGKHTRTLNHLLRGNFVPITKFSIIKPEKEKLILWDMFKKKSAMIIEGA